MTSNDFICPCGKNKNLYIDCCKLIHDDIFQAESAEQLMRSRYSAFVLCKGDYLLLSHSQKYRDPNNIENTIRWSRSVAWNHLEIIETIDGKIGDDHGTVEFKAYFKEKNKIKFIHEKSFFIKENNHWVYEIGS